MILRDKPTTRAVPIEVRNEIVIPAPAEPVWDLLANIEAWPSWHRACRWVRIEAAGDDARPAPFRWKAHPIELQTAERLRTVVESHETQVGWLPWLGRLVLAPRLDAANQAWLSDLARMARRRGAPQATAKAR